MKLKEILAISGQSGLYKFVAQSKNGIIVEQLGSGVRSCASASAKVSSLGEIAIFTENDDVGSVVQPASGSGNDRLQGGRASGRENARRGIEPLFPQRDARRSPKVQW